MAVVGILTALLALAISSAPGWREMRWFAGSSALASAFTLANVLTTLEVPLGPRLVGAQLNLFFGGLHVLCWYRYAAVSSTRPMPKVYGWIERGGVVVSATALVPGAYLTRDVAERAIPALGVVYRDPIPTRLGALAFAYFCASLVALLVEYVARSRRGEPTARAHVVAFAALVVAGVHDSFAAADLLRSPYVLDLSMLVVVLAVGGSTASRFVSTARELDASARELARAHEELVRHERMAAFGELAATVAHEVRNPVAILFNAVAGLRKASAGSADHEQLLVIVQEEAERLRDMVSDLLELARPRCPVLAPARLDEVVTGAVEAARRAAGVPEGDVVTTIAGEVPPLVCDEQLVRQAIINLVSNALQAEGRNEPVRVTIADSAAAVTIRVEDDGRGVPAELRSTIFKPFFSTRARGTGLGLAVVQRSAETHGGEVAVSETPGGGATFELRLPRRAA